MLLNLRHLQFNWTFSDRTAAMVIQIDDLLHPPNQDSVVLNLVQVGGRRIAIEYIIIVYRRC